MPLVDISIAEPCFDADWQSCSFGGGDGGDRYVGAVDQCGSSAFDGGFGGTTHIDVDTVKAELHAVSGKLFHVAWLAAPDLGDQWMLVVGLDEPPGDGFVASMHPAGGIGKLGEKHVGRARLFHDMAKYHVRDGFHGRQDKEWLR